MRARVARLRLRLLNGGQGFSAYARLLEEAATLASAEAGYPAQWYGREKTAWVIRRSTIECVAPLARAADLEVVTWVADFRRVRSRREYEVYASPGTVATVTANTDWVYVERASGRPRRIPDSMINAFAPGGSPPALPRAPLVLPAVAGEATAVERLVAPEDVDALGHVNNARYFDYIEEASKSVARAGLRPIRHDLEYLTEALAGDRLLCRCWWIAPETSHVEIATEIRRGADGTPLTRARSVWTA